MAESNHTLGLVPATLNGFVVTEFGDMGARDRDGK
jgi:hypothetical protein